MQFGHFGKRLTAMKFHHFRRRRFHLSGGALAEFDSLIDAFLQRLHSVTVLDPACGSGNFLYVALKMLLDLEKEVITFATMHGGRLRTPGVRPTQLHGIEINTYAAELAQIVIWIGLLQWQKENGFPSKDDPILEKVQTIENRDAILDRTNLDSPLLSSWPSADYIVGNPPFLGNRFIVNQLGPEYLNCLEAAYHTLGHKPDLCCYWFERARLYLTAHPKTRVGLIAT